MIQMTAEAAQATRTQPVVEMSGVSVSFPGVKALQSVGLTLRPGEVHALMGENGAGKSTLIKALTGVYSIDEGTILVGGEAAYVPQPGRVAGRRHQHGLSRDQPVHQPHGRREHAPRP